MSKDIVLSLILLKAGENIEQQQHCRQRNSTTSQKENENKKGAMGGAISLKADRQRAEVEKRENSKLKAKFQGGEERKKIKAQDNIDEFERFQNSLGFV